jgi:hypothetical protein
MHRLAAAGHPKAIAAIPALLARCIPVCSAPDHLERENIHQVHTLVAGLQIGSAIFRAVVTVRDTTLGMTYYGHRIESLGMKMSGDLGEVLKPEGHSSDSHPQDTIKLCHLLDGFKPL